MAIAGKTYIDPTGKRYWYDNQSEALPLPFEQQQLLEARQVSIDQLIGMMEKYRFSAQQLLFLGHAAGKLGNAWITEMAFTEAIELEPDLAQAYGDVISYHAAQQQWETCREFWEQGMLKASEKVYIRYHYARALYLQERYADAFTEANQGLLEVKYQHEELTLLALHAALGRLATGQCTDKQKTFRETKLLWQSALKRFPESEMLVGLAHLLDQDAFEE